ncbi:Pimeloyl-ACP methyl ester carboxylesterase [Sphingobium sp. AP50]|uniref:epoxide hydrolase family protein n=1 Tax=Sphingobium sp. AP50 TaxID=1884369 RepID=UPI0008CB0DDC|nr:epoxide hydrolase family protein [Sphingobium sp. AP50]SEJ81386.1 Pimeloyl-ACP methyl ester carboxylesterase [Sphingobium sp. AP50]
MFDPRFSRRELIGSGIALAALAGAAKAAVPGSQSITPFKINVPDSDLQYLKMRLENTRWPDKEIVDDLSQGVPLARMRALADYWRTKYDWRRAERQINAFPQFITRIDGIDIHFVHIRSKHDEAMPLIMTHGWPGSIVELLKVIGPLTDPTAHGGKASDAFHLVLPTIPGFGFSGKPTEKGWGRHRVAKTWGILMERLGYARYVAQGGDWGSVITQAMGQQAPAGLVAIHVNMPATKPKVLPATLTSDEALAAKQIETFYGTGAGYAIIQFTRPQTIGYALADSPIGQAAWIYDKFIAWTDSGGVPERVLSVDEMLDDIMFYWLTNDGASSARMYWENGDLSYDRMGGVNIPVAVSVFPAEIYQAPKSWCEQSFPNLYYYNRPAKGGHFAAFEQPELFTQEIRQAFRQFRQPA